MLLSAAKKHAEFVQGILKKQNPLYGMHPFAMSVRHHDDERNKDFAYPVTAHAPQDFVMPSPEELKRTLPMAKFMEVKKAVEKGGDDFRKCAGGRWITVHPHGEEEGGHPVYICPNPDGSHTVVGGAGGKLNGLKMVGVKSPEEYAAMARTKREHDRAVQKEAQKTQQAQLGVAKYRQQQQEKKKAVGTKREQRIQRERDAIQQVLEQQGIDPSVMDVPKEHLAAFDEGTQKAIADSYHRKLYHYAKQVKKAIQDLVGVGLEGEVGKNGDVGISDISRIATGDTGRGYVSPIRALSEEFSIAEKGEAVEGFSARSLIERSGGSLEGAKAKQESSARLKSQKSEQQKKIEEAAAALKEHGLDVSTLPFDPAPKIETYGQAFAILKAFKEADLAKREERDLKRQLSIVDDMVKLPKGALLPVKDLSPEEAAALIGNDLDEDRRRSSMLALVGESNAVEMESGTLRQHISVGQNLAFNSVLSEVDGTSIDPLTHDLLGATGAAQAIVARWRSEDPTKLAKIQQALEGFHLRTQEQIANDATEQAKYHFAEYDRLQLDQDSLGEIEKPEDIEAVLLLEAEKTDALRQAREVLGVARGRLEGIAALVEAVRSPKESVTVSIGQMGIEAGFDAAIALGLKNPTMRDENGNVTKEGDFDLTSDGKNTILTINHDGLKGLSVRPDAQVSERRERSRAIKRGDKDEADFIPHGLASRPATTFETQPEQRTPTQLVTGIVPEDTAGDMAAKAALYIGGLIDSGRSPAQAESIVRSEEFVRSLSLPAAAEKRFLAAMDTVSPSFDGRGSLDDYKAWEKSRAERYAAYHGEFVKSQGAANAAVEGQTIPTDGRMSDVAYTTLLSDPRLKHGFTPLGELSVAARGDVRRWAYENLFGLDPKSTDENITPMNDDERLAWQEWSGLRDKGDVYGQIQQAWAGEAGQGDNLFGEQEPAHPLSQVPLSDAVGLVELARKNPRLLGYEPSRTMHEGQIFETVPEALTEGKQRTFAAIAQDVRSRARRKLREYFFTKMLGRPELGDAGFNPETVRSASDRWGEYAKHMGVNTAYETVQEMMRGAYLEKFAGAWGEATGEKLAIARKSLSKADRHAEAMLPPEVRQRLRGADSATVARLIRGQRGRFEQQDESVQDKAELERAKERGGPVLFGDSSQRNIETDRATLGASVEGALSGVLPLMDISAPTEAARNLNLSTPKTLPVQRAIKLIAENEKQGVNLGTGLGKSLVGIGAFTHLRGEGKASRALFVVPSNILGQFGAEMDKFRDPSVPLVKWHSGGKNAQERMAALGNEGIHACIVTPESLRDDVTRMVASHQGISVEAARDKLMGLSEPERHTLVADAMEKHGANFDYCFLDEAHRLLGEDVHMAKVAKSVGRKAKYLPYSTADPIKNNAKEAYSVLSLLDPDRYPESGQADFLRKYGRNTVASGLALQRELEPYLYPEQADLGIETSHVRPSEGKMALTPEQQQAYSDVKRYYDRAKAARLKGQVDTDAIERLFPAAFEGVTDPSERQTLGEKYLPALASLRDTAYHKVVNAFPGGAKENYVSEYAGAHKGEPIVVFTRLRESATNVAKRLKEEGHRVTMLTGNLSGKEKDKVRLAFQPASGEASADILVSTDAGAMGANLQRGRHVIQMDVPLTAMVHQQRIGRIRRMGQKSGTIDAVDLSSDTDYDSRMGEILAKKSKLREITTSPMGAIDDSGLAALVEESGLRGVTKNASAA